MKRDLHQNGALVYSALKCSKTLGERHQMPSNQPAAPDYFTVRGLAPTAPATLNDALRKVLDAMPTMLHGEPSRELTEAEREVLIKGGARLDAEPEGDPLAATTAQFAALISTSLTTKGAAARLGLPESRIRQMIARRTLYSVLLDNRRHIPAFQFAQRGGAMGRTGPSPSEGSLIPNIAKVNAALPEDLHPVEVQAWYTQPHADLFVGDDVDARISPLDWLRSGGDVSRVAQLARWL